MEENNTNGIPSANAASMAAAFEGSLAIIAVVLGWAFGVMPTETFNLEPASSLPAIGWGLAATVPLFGLLWVCVVIPWGPLDKLTRTVEEIIGPMLGSCSFADLAAVSLLAGLGEEMLFRGFLQPLVAGWAGEQVGVWVGLGVASLIFGLLHAITPTYAVVACLIGLFLGGLWLATGNLLAPITAHAVYDFLALVYFLRIRSGGPESQ
ncbi:MAG: CPBP family intramembrane metalloprotease [Pirellulales bacterium]|nr:CPBP family intramembrane metalloprotease [Pirellulales bacterium]